MDLTYHELTDPYLQTLVYGAAAFPCWTPSFSDHEEGTMRYQWLSPSLSKRVVLGFAFALCAVMALTEEHVGAQTPTKLEATIFSYDGQDLVRVRTTLRTEDGKSAVNTKLSRETPAYKALIQKRSYSGDVTVFGRKYDANYAPLTSEDGRLTGALFVAVAQ